MILLLLLIVVNDPKSCFDLIKSGKIKLAESKFHELKHVKSDHYTFLSAYFSRNTIYAIEQYTALYEQSKQLEVKNFAQHKLYQYYYALGLYKKAELFKTETEIDSKLYSPKDKESYTIQMGVFSAESNALALKQKIRKIIKDKISLKKVLREGKSVIVVNVGKYTSRDKALTHLNNLRDRLGLSGWIKAIN